MVIGYQNWWGDKIVHSLKHVLYKWSLDIKIGEGINLFNSLKHLLYKCILSPDIMRSSDWSDNVSNRGWLMLPWHHTPLVMEHWVPWHISYSHKCGRLVRTALSSTRVIVLRVDTRPSWTFPRKGLGMAFFVDFCHHGNNIHKTNIKHDECII